MKILIAMYRWMFRTLHAIIWISWKLIYTLIIIIIKLIKFPKDLRVVVYLRFKDLQCLRLKIVMNTIRKKEINNECWLKVGINCLCHARVTIN